MASPNPHFSPTNDRTFVQVERKRTTPLKASAAPSRARRRRRARMKV